MRNSRGPDPASFKREVLNHPYQEERRGNGGSRFSIVLSLVALLLCVVLFFFMVQLNSQLKSRAQQLNDEIIRLGDLVESVERDLEQQLTANSHKTDTISDDVAQVQKSVGLSQSEIAENRTLAQQLREKQERDVQNIASQLTVKADSQKVADLEKESGVKFQEIDEEIAVVKEDVQESRVELEKAYQELTELGLSVTEQGKLIATTGQGLEELRKRGEREYVAFDLQKKRRTTVAGVGVELRKAHTKDSYADLRLFYDDRRFDRKKIYVNSPITFYVGSDKTPYELVINDVLKNRINGYISLPPDKLPSSPELHRHKP